MARAELSDAIQDYLKEIYKLGAAGERATTSAIARRMGVAPSSATSMLKKLAVLGLAEHAPYRGAVLTEAGDFVLHSPEAGDDIAEAILYAVGGPERVAVNEVLVRPAGQQR